MSPVHVVREALESLARELRRIAPMAAGIVWGVASVFLLAAIANGFERTQRQVVEAFGDAFLLLRFNKPAVSKADPEATRRITIDDDDIARIRAGAPAVESISPKAFVWRARTFRGDRSTWMTPAGVDPQYIDICNVPLEPGSRWIDASDVENESPVVVIGPQVRKDLFGEEPWLDQTVKITLTRGGPGGGGGAAGEVEAYTRDFNVIGCIQDIELSDEFYVSNKRIGFVTYPMFERISEKGADFVVIRPRTADETHLARLQICNVLSERYHFEEGDTNTVLPYFDALERGRKIDRVFGGIKLFLGAVGLLILLLGAVGVANVVLMSVAARTFEFGLRRALGCRRRWIFGQVFLEAGLVCLLSGVLGFALGLLFVDVVGRLPLPDGFARPEADMGAATIPGLLLLAVTLCAALWPASRAVRMSPVEALRGNAI